MNEQAYASDLLTVALSLALTLQSHPDFLQWGEQASRKLDLPKVTWSMKAGGVGGGGWAGGNAAPGLLTSHPGMISIAS